MRAIFAASSPMRSRSVTILMMASTRRRSPAAGWRRAIKWLHSVSMLTSSPFTRWSSAMTVSSASTSPDVSASTAARICASTRPPISSTRERSVSSSMSYCLEEWSVMTARSWIGSAEPAGYVIFGFLARRLNEQGVGGAEFDQFTQIHISSVVRHAGRLLHVVRHDDHRVVGLELIHQFFDPRRGNRIQRRAGLIEQQHFGLDSYPARDTQPL